MADPTISRSEAFEFEWRLERKDPVTGQLAPLPGDTPVQAWLSATSKGDPITPGSVVPLARRGIELRDDARELWFAVLAVDDVTVALAGIVTNDPVYETIEFTTADGGTERRSRELFVAD